MPNPISRWPCEGRSAHESGDCRAPALYKIMVGLRGRYACGRHVGWMLHYMLVPGRDATVRMLDHA